MVTEASVLSMLGQDSRKYHSCVAATFSFDFGFFEMTALRALKATGVRNTLVLVDERMLTELMENPSGMEFRTNRGYGLYPMTSSGAFHPKLIFCVGRKQGFLAVGSGNLTASGHGHGSELWSVFHFEGLEGPTAGIFAQAWSYVKSITFEVAGNSREKLHWMESNAPWLADLPAISLGQPVNLSGNLVSLRGIGPNTDGLSAIIHDLEGLEVNSITVMSPFYDSNGGFLTALSDAFPAIHIDVILETEYGLLPHGIAGNMFRFHDWTQVRPIEDEHKRRLHAKLLLFTLKDGREYAVIGSSNATRPGHGTGAYGALNHELNCHITWQKPGLLSRLGIKLSQDSVIQLSELPEGVNNGIGNETSDIPKTLRIKYAEHLGATLQVMTEGAYTAPAAIHFYDHHGQPVSQVGGLTFERVIQITLPDSVKGTAYLAWHDDKGVALSGKQILQNTASHFQGNPDRRAEELNNIFQGIEDGNFGRVEDLLRYVGFEDDEGTQNLTSASNEASSLATRDAANDGEVLGSYEEFTSVAEHLLNRQKGLLTSPNVLIAEFLSTFSNRQLTSVSIDSEEQTGSLDIDELEPERTSLKPAKRNGSTILREKRAVQHFIKKFQSSVVVPWVKSLSLAPQRAKPFFSPQAITISQLSAYLITAQLMRKYLRRPYIFDNEGHQVSGHFIEIGGHDGEISLRSYTWEVVGPFLTQLRAGVKYYENEGLRNKANGFLLESSFMSLLTVCNNHWQNIDMPWWNLFLANGVLTVCASTPPDQTRLWIEFTTWRNNTLSTNEFVSPQLHTHLEHLRLRIVPDVVKFLSDRQANQLLTRSAGDLNVGDYIFVSVFGFCMVVSVAKSHSEGEYVVGLSNPAFTYDPDSHDNIRVENFKSVVMFEMMIG